MTLTKETLADDTQLVYDIELKEEVEEDEVIYPDKGQTLVT